MPRLTRKSLAESPARASPRSATKASSAASPSPARYVLVSKQASVRLTGFRFRISNKIKKKYMKGFEILDTGVGKQC